jgi:hypothetical protein
MALTVRNTKSVALLIVALASLFSVEQCCGSGGSGITPDEYTIYSRLTQYFNLSGRPLVITAQTSVDDDKEVLRKDVLRHLTREFPAPYPKTIADFKAKNAHSLPLDQKLPGINSYTLVPSEELDKLWDGCKTGKTCGWDLFYSKYPDSSGIVNVSRVGFSASGDDALVYLGHRSDWKAGTGYLVLLHKNNGDWDVVKSVVVWMS